MNLGEKISYPLFPIYPIYCQLNLHIVMTLRIFYNGVRTASSKTFIFGVFITLPASMI